MSPPTSIGGTDITGATIDGTDVQEITVDGQTVFTAVPAGAFDIKELGPINHTLPGTPTDLAFNNDGSKVFIVDEDDEFKEFSLSTNFDLSSASNTPVVVKPAFDGGPTGIELNDDGTKIYDCGFVGDAINEGTLTTPFDLSTISSSPDVNISSNDSSPQSIRFNDDGTKFYEAGLASNIVTQYSTSTAFSISGMSQDGTFGKNISSGIQGIEWNDDGTKFYEVGPGNLGQYDLSTPFDLSSRSGFEQVSISAQSRGFAWNDTGSRGYIANNGSGINERLI